MIQTIVLPVAIRKVNDSDLLMAELSSDTRKRLIEAGLQVFSSKGYAATSVRDICSAAGANTAAVNYHFGGKAALYRYLFEEAYERLTASMEPLVAGDAYEGLYAHYSALLKPFTQGPASMLRAQLYAREELEPSGLLDSTGEAIFKQWYHTASSFVARHTGLTAGAPQVQRAVLSIIGLLSVYFHSHSLLRQVAPDAFELSDKDDLARELADKAFLILEYLKKQGTTHVA